MPTVLRVEGFVIRIYLNDHAPAHIHVFKSGAEAVITLNPVILLRVWRMKSGDAADAVRIVQENRPALLRSWKAIHGEQEF